MKRMMIVAAIMATCVAAVPLSCVEWTDEDIKTEHNRLDKTIWTRSFYAWQDSSISKVTRAGFWTGCSALTAGLLCTLAKSYAPSATLSRPGLLQGLAGCGAIGWGLFAYGANTLMQYYRHFLSQGVDRKNKRPQPHRTTLCKTGIAFASVYSVRGNMTHSNDI